MNTSRQRLGLVFAIISTFLIANRATADTTKDALDAAKADYSKSQQQADDSLLAAFDSQVKILSQGGDLDAVEGLIAQRKVFAASKTLPSASSMRASLAVYQDATASNNLRLKAAYQTAIAEYTKSQNFDDAINIKQLMLERFPATETNGQQSTNEGANAGNSADPIVDKLQLAKQDFSGTIRQAHTELLGVIDKKGQ